VITTNYKKGMFEAKSQLLTIKTRILRDVRSALREGEKAGFPDYEALFLTNAGKKQKRQLKTIRPEFLRIGTAGKPLSFEFVYPQGWEKVIDATADAFELLQRRAPVDSGKYLKGFRIMVGGRDIGTRRLDRVKFDEKDTVLIVNPTDYAATIEKGFYKKYYQTRTLRFGIMYWATQQIRRKYGNNISVRFIYMQGDRYTVPAIELAPAGRFVGTDTRPSSRRRRRRRG
jgi:hypothetical protein